MKQYSFKSVDLIIDGNRVDGYPSGNSIVSAGRNVAQHQPVVGAYGEMAVVTIADLTGLFTFPLMQTADWNEELYSKAQFTQAAGLSGNKSLWQPMQLQLVDKMGDVLVTGVNGFIIKQPTLVRGSGLTNNQWAIYVEKLITVTGNYPDAGL